MCVEGQAPLWKPQRLWGLLSPLLITVSPPLKSDAGLLKRAFPNPTLLLVLDTRVGSWGPWQEGIRWNSMPEF